MGVYKNSLNYKNLKLLNIFQIYSREKSLKGLKRVVFGASFQVHFRYVFNETKNKRGNYVPGNLYTSKSLIAFADHNCNFQIMTAILSTSTGETKNPTKMNVTRIRQWLGCLNENELIGLEVTNRISFTVRLFERF